MQIETDENRVDSNLRFERAETNTGNGMHIEIEIETKQSINYPTVSEIEIE